MISSDNKPLQSHCSTQLPISARSENGSVSTDVIQGTDVSPGLRRTDESNDAAQLPYNWGRSRKWMVAGAAMLGSLILPLNGTSITVARQSINSEFHIDDSTFPNSYWAVTSWTLGGAVFIILGLPLLEDLGVRTGYMISYLFFLLMIIPQAVAQNFATLIVSRFFAGGCVMLLGNIIASIIPDLWEDDRARTFPVSVYILCFVMGSTLGPPTFAAVGQHVHGWRWFVITFCMVNGYDHPSLTIIRIFYIQLIVYGSLFPLFILLIKETRSSVILRRHAKQSRSHSGKVGATSVRPPLLGTLRKAITRPAYLLFTEPVLLASTLWSAFSFGTVYLFTQSVEQVFTELYQWPAYKTSYVQGAVVIGEILGWVASLYGSHLFLKSAERNEECPGRPIPEARLYVSIFGSFFGMSGGMFVYAWTSYPDFPWIAPAIGLAMVGFGIQTVVSAVADYITDAYAASEYAGSAISAVAAGENIVAGFLPLVTQQMYKTLGLQWASSLLGFLAFVLSFAPVIFVWKGRWFRARSPFMQAGIQQQKEKFDPSSG